MEKICLIYQPAGIGDVFYAIGIARHYQKLGYKIVWPVVEEILDTMSYIPDIDFCDWKKDFPKKEFYKDASLEVINTEEFVFLPIHKSTDVLDGLVMPTKYQLANVPSHTWFDSFVWNRNTEKENKLYYDVLGLKEDEPYILVNSNFVTPPRTVTFPINIEQTDARIVKMDYIEGYNVFDWAKVLENASGIITIDTCIQYIIEKLNMKSQFYYCYLRNGIYTYIQIKDLFNKTPWTFLDVNNNIIK